MNSSQLLIGAGVGMTVVFMFDPSRGRRRRALAADQIRRARRKTRDALDATARDIANRTVGIVAATRLANDDVDDATLVDRVRAKLGRVCSHPRAIDVDAANGVVTLRGPVLTTELDKLLGAVSAVHGVGSVRNELEPHDSADNIPSLQGAGTVAGPTLDVLQRNWAPGTQALVAVGLAATGVCLAAYVRRHAGHPGLRALALSNRVRRLLIELVQGRHMAETKGPKDPMEGRPRRQTTDPKGALNNARPQQLEDSRAIGQDDRLIGAERFPRKGDDE
jgi:gas vesicle protein